MNDIEYRILSAQAGKGTLPDCSDPATLEIAAALVDAKLIRGNVLRALGDDAPGVTLGALTHAGLEALDAEERAREERRVLARLAARGDRLLMAVLAALVGLLLQRWLAPAKSEACPCRHVAEQRADGQSDKDAPCLAAHGLREKAVGVAAPVFRDGEIGLKRLDAGRLSSPEIVDEAAEVELSLPDADGGECGAYGAALVE